MHCHRSLPNVRPPMGIDRFHNQFSNFRCHLPHNQSAIEFFGRRRSHRNHENFNDSTHRVHCRSLVTIPLTHVQTEPLSKHNYLWLMGLGTTIV